MIWAVGELALHIFVPDGASRPPTPAEGPVQLGGGAAMVARTLLAANHPVRLAGLVGSDASGELINHLIASTFRDSVSVQDRRARSSSVFLMCDEQGMVGLRVSPGGVNPNELLPAVQRLAAEDSVYCPAFPGYEAVIAAVCSRSRWVLVDTGFAPYMGDYDRMLGLIAGLPPAGVVLINAKGFDAAARRRLIDCALGARAQYVVLTDGPAPALLVDDQNEVLHCPETVHERCAIGAGDTLAAWLLAALEREQRLNENSFRRAVAAATQKVTRWGVLEDSE